MKHINRLLKWHVLLPAITLLCVCGVHAQVPSLVFTQRWALGPGSRYDIPATADNNSRGVAYNKLTGNILYASRTSSNHIAVLKGLDGSEVGTISNSFMAGTLALVHVRVADDGVVYACNLYGGSGSIFKVYRWSSEANAIAGEAPVLAFSQGPVGASVQRYGDSFDVRGAGTDTQFAVSGSSATTFAIFTTTDGTNFTATEFTHGLGTGELGKGISFDGTNNVVYGKKESSLILHRVGFDIPTVTSTLITNITLPATDGGVVGTKSLEGNGVKFVIGGLTGSGTTATAHRFKAYTVNNASAPSVSADLAYPGPFLADANVLGANDGSSTVAVSQQSNNGLIVFDIGYVTNLAPAIVSQPVDQTNVLAGGYISFSVGASGTDPKTYRWKFNDTTDVPGGTNSTLTLTNITAANAGFYKCAVSNVAGFAISTNATLVVTPSVLSSVSAPLWGKVNGDLFFLVNDGTQRGMAFNALSNHLIVVSRTPTNGVHVLDASTGAYLRSLDMSFPSLGAGTFLVNMVGVGDDGAIYVANLDTAGVNYTIYRWDNDDAATVAGLAYGPANPGVGRVGDTLAVRGGGVNTEILTSSRSGTQVLLFNTADGFSFNPNTIDVNTQPVGFAGLGLAFGEGNTFWAKAGGIQFRHIGYDLTAATNGLLQTFAAGQGTAAVIGVDPVNQYVAGVALATPDNVELYDVNAVVTGAATEPTLVDQEFFKTDLANGNGTGSVAFDVAGGRIFALNSNNGLLALKYGPRVKSNVLGGKVVLNWSGPGVLQSSANVAGTYVDVGGATSPYTNNSPTSVFFRVRR